MFCIKIWGTVLTNCPGGEIFPEPKKKIRSRGKMARPHNTGYQNSFKWQYMAGAGAGAEIRDKGVAENK